MYPVGTNVLNDRTIAESARGLADYVTARKGADAPRSCVIARDTRHNSPEFAELLRRVLAAAGFKVYPLPRAALDPPALLRRPAPGLRRRDHDHGLAQPAVGQRLQVLRRDRRPGRSRPTTPASSPASRRPPTARSPRSRSRKAWPTARSSWSGPRSTTPTSRPSSASRSARRATCRSSTRRCTASARPRWPRPCCAAGFERVNILASQRTPDGDFPNVPGHVSNPEIPKTLDAAIAEARATGADLVLASDPDADRIGVAVPVTGDPKGEWTTLDGNQIGVLLAAFVMKQTKAPGRLRPDHYLVTTLVTSQMARALAEREGVRDRGRPARRLQVDRPADRRGRARRASCSASRSRTAT